MLKEFFLAGFFLLVFLLFMIFPFILGFDKKRFFLRTVFMFQTLILFTAHKRKLRQKQHKPAPPKHAEHKSVHVPDPARAPKISLFFNTAMWSLLSLTFLLFASLSRNKILLSVGLIITGYALFLNAIKIIALKRKWTTHSHHKNALVKKTAHNHETRRRIFLQQTFIKKGYIGKLKFEGFFLIGFFMLVFFLVAKRSFIASIGGVIMVLALIIDFDKKRFFSRDAFMLGYAFSTAIVVVSFVLANILSLVFGVLGMLFALFLFILHKRKLLKERHKQILLKHPEHKFVPSRAPKKSVFLNANMWSLLSITLLLFSGFLRNLPLLISGLLLSTIALTLQVIKIRTLKKKWKDLSYKRVLDIKSDLKIRRSKYETDFDKLIRVVQKYQMIRLSEIANAFNIPLEKAEEWGKTLEEHGLLHVHFPPIGEAELRWK